MAIRKLTPKLKDVPSTFTSGSIKSIPFSLLPPKVVISASRNLRGFGEFFSAFFPSLHESLLQAKIQMQPREYAAIAYVASSVNAFFIALLVIFVGIVSRQLNLIPLAILLAVVVSMISFLTIIFYPKIIAAKRVREIENQLIPAVRQLAIEVKSGVSLFNAMASISDDYGEVSEEFKIIVKKINAGTPELDALSESTQTNPSFQYRKVLWQVSNALKTGSNIAAVLNGLIVELTADKIDQIRKYGQEISPWVMAYMMAAVIIPSLGVTMLLVILNFLSANIPPIILPVIAVLLLGFQIFFINFVGSRRPMV